MTTVPTSTQPTTRAGTTRPAAAPDRPTIAALRRVIRADAALCAASGALALLAARPLADLADVDGGGAIAAAGVFLLVLAGALTWLARTHAPTLVRLTPWSADGDLLWVVGSIVVAATVAMNGLGRALVVVQAVAVLGVAVAKLGAHRRARRAIIGAR